MKSVILLGKEWTDLSALFCVRILKNNELITRYVKQYKANRQNCPITKTMNRTCLLAPMLSHYPIMLKFLFARSGEQM